MASAQCREKEGHGFKSLLRLMPTYDEQAQVPLQQQQEKGVNQQRKESLELEVAKLQMMLKYEENLHQVLQRAFHRPIGSLPYLPDFVPNEIRELLMEVAMVEDGISRLEGEVNDLRHGLSQERDSYNSLYYRHQLQQQQQQQQQQQKQQQLRQQKQIEIQDRDNAFPYRVSLLLDERPKTQATHRRRHASMGSAHEADALFSISQAIKSVDLASGFSKKEMLGRPTTASLKRQQSLTMMSIKGHEDGFQGTDAKGSTIEKASQAKLPPRHPSLKKDEKGAKNTCILSQKLPAALTGSQDNSTHMTVANKLSEDIMKCLICIFLRVLRTSRMARPDKSANSARTALSPFPSFLKTENFSSLQDPCLDPYGIFDTEESVPRDIGPYKNFVIVTSSSFSITNLASCAPLLEQLRILLSKLCKVQLEFLTYKQKLAFWINIYNACIMHAYLQHGVQSNHEKLLALIKKVELNIGGCMLNAFAIEHLILGQSIGFENEDEYWKAENDMRESIVHNKYRLDNREPNITFALCCGSRSSPVVRIYTAQDVHMELERSKLEYLQASIVVTCSRKLVIPKLLQQYMRDCSTNIDLLIDWVCNQLPLSCSLRKSIIECIRAHKNETISTFAEVMPYQFEFQYLLVT